MSNQRGSEIIDADSSDLHVGTEKITKVKSESRNRQQNGEIMRYHHCQKNFLFPSGKCLVANGGQLISYNNRYRRRLVRPRVCSHELTDHESMAIKGFANVAQAPTLPVGTIVPHGL